MLRRSVLLGVVCLLATACSGSDGSSGAGSEDGEGGQQQYATDGTFTMAVSYDMGVFDPYRSGLVNTVAGLAYDSLVNVQPDGEVVSGLAEEWTVDADAATFTLRPDVTCSDGTPLTASQVVADLTYLSDPANESPQYGSNVPTVPFTATADDAARTVEITMESPFGFLLSTIGGVPIMCATGLEDPDLLATASDGTGPFVLTEVVPGQSYTFTRRDGYTWGPAGASTSEPGTPATVVLRIITNQTTSANLLLSGEVNLASNSGPDQQRLSAAGLDSFQNRTYGPWLWFNQIGDRVTADPEVRQALVTALDLDEVIRVGTGGTGSAATGLIAREPKVCPGDTLGDALPEQDVAGAESLLDAAGWVRGADGVRAKDGEPLAVDLHYLSAGPTSTYNKPTVELMAQKWEDIGVDVEIVADDAGTFNQIVFQTSSYDVLMQGWDAVRPDQMTGYLSGATPPDGINFSGVDNDQYNELVAEASALVAPDSCTHWNEAEQALWQTFDVLPIAETTLPYFLKDAEAETNGSDIPIPTSIRVLG